MTGSTLNAETLLGWQQEQFRHDHRNHTDIVCLSRIDRLKHYGLHFAKYAGRIARDEDDREVLTRTTVDALLVCLSAANALAQRLDQSFDRTVLLDFRRTLLIDLADASGRFCDACEKIDHLEDFLAIARSANCDILHWILSVTSHQSLNIEALLKARRSQLAERQFLIPREI